jgi:hypothetical protein
MISKATRRFWKRYHELPALDRFMNTRLKQLSCLAVIILMTALLGCSRQAQQEQPAESQPIHINAPPLGAEPYVFMLILTNAQPPPMRSAIAISKTMNYEWHKIANDGTASTVRGVVPTDIYDGVMAEGRAMSGRTNVDLTREQPVYVGAVDGVHPVQVQRLLDYLSK